MNDQMPDLEICGSYRRGKDQSIQITILSELTGKSEYEIMRILLKHGYELPQKRIQRMCKRLDVLDGRIAAAEREYKEICKTLFTQPEEKERAKYGGRMERT